MKQRVEIKALGKENFKEQRSIGILLYFLYTSVIGCAVGIVATIFVIPFMGAFTNFATNESLEALFAYSSAMSFYSFLITIASLVIVAALQVGLHGSFLRIFRKEKTHVEDLFANFKTRFSRYLGGMLWMYLFTFLWSLLFAIPGIIKSYAYRMTSFILADSPEVKAKDAIKISMRMTKGYKGKLFVLDLSFLGWFLLSGLTCGILSIVYVMPYYTSTLAGYYEELKEQALTSGAITAEELA